MAKEHKPDQFKVQPLRFYCTSLMTGKTALSGATKGGLVAVGTSLDPHICADNRMVGSVVGPPATLPPVWGPTVLLDSLQFVDFEIHCSERVFASIDGKTYEWDDAPSSAPWGLLGRQLALKSELTSPSLLKIVLQSGDYIEIETVKSEFESVIFQLPPKGETLIMEIF